VIDQAIKVMHRLSENISQAEEVRRKKSAKRFGLEGKFVLFGMSVISLSIWVFAMLYLKIHTIHFLK